MKDGIILWEAHRAGGGGYEMPESCAFSFEYGWRLGGRPEADVNVTSDGVLVSLHDSTLDRICPNLPSSLKGRKIWDMTWAELQTADIGWKDYTGLHVPSLAMLFEQLRLHPERAMIIDYKRVSIQLLAELIHKYGVGSQITFASNQRALLREFKSLVPEGRTKNWLGGTAENIQKQFRTIEEENFAGITEVQLHLNDAASPNGWRYDLPSSFVSEALDIARKHGVLLQAAPWSFELKDIFAILDLGVRSFAVDYPNRFTIACAEYFSRQWPTPIA